MMSEPSFANLRFGTVVAALVAALLLVLVAPASADVLANVKQRKSLLCGVDPGVPGFATVDDRRQWSGFDVDYCRAIAAAVLGDARAVTFVPLTARERFKAVTDGSVDVVIRNTEWTMARDTSFGVTFVGVDFYNGEGFMVRRGLGINSALQLSGARICVETGSTTEVAVAAYFKTHGMTYVPVMVGAGGERTAYETGQCDAFTGDLVALYSQRLLLSAPDDSIVLPEIVTKEPYGPLVMQTDYRWQSVVRWVHFALLDAEELGVTAANVAAMKQNDNSDIRQLLGTDGALGKSIGLDAAWAANAIAAVGNYGEIFDRNLGSGSSLQIPRGLNALWTDGGIQFAPPIH
jgi:general L-amino acid transport system substrate-binding protein